MTTLLFTVTLFSDRIVGSIKTSIKRADQRPAEQALIAKDISNYVFAAENAAELIGKHMTSKPLLHTVLDPYNAAIDTIRKNEYVYLSTIRRYWGDAAVASYMSFVKDVSNTDDALHAFNEAFAPVETGTQAKADDAKTDPLVPPAYTAVIRLKRSSRELLLQLSE